MKKRVIGYLLVLVLVVAGILLRLLNLTGRMTFGWDQERDIVAVVEMITTRRPKLIGPVVRGEGGFMLGPLYYYLLLPGVWFLKGHPVSLGLTSIGIDLLTMLYFCWLTYRYFSPKAVWIAGTIWAISPFFTKSALTSWNVSLIPLYSLAVFHVSMILLDKESEERAKRKAVLGLVALAGIAFHVHASLLLLVPFLVISLLRHQFFRYLDWKQALVVGAAPLVPLLVFDIRHQWINSHLVWRFLTQRSSEPSTSWWLVVQTLWQKYSLYFLKLLLPLHQPVIGYIVSGLSWVYLWKQRRKPTFRLMGAYLIYNLVLLGLYRYPDFPEYYFNLLLPIFIWLWTAMLLDWGGFKHNLLLGIGVSLYWIVAIILSDFKTQPYSLKAKLRVVERISRFSQQVDLRSELSPGRFSGFSYLLDYFQVKRDESSPHKLVLRDDDRLSSVAGAKLVFSEFIYGYHLLGFVVE